MQRNADEEGLHLSKANPAPSFVIEECHECQDHFIGSFLQQIYFTLNLGAGSTLSPRPEQRLRQSRQKRPVPAI
jgi:hypothetical protein